MSTASASADDARPGLRPDLAHASTSSACSPATGGSSRSCAASWATPRRPSASTASSPATGRAPSSSSPPSTAACGRAGRSSAPPAAPPSPSATVEAHWVGEPPVGVPDDRPGHRGAARHHGGPRHRAHRRAAAAHRRHGRRDHLRRRAPLGAGARDRRPTSSRLPELALMLATDLAVLDHTDGSILLVANAVNYDDTDERVELAWADAVARLDAMTRALAAPADSTVAVVDTGAVDDAMARRALQHHPRAVRGGRRARQGGHPGRRGVPGRSLATVLDGLRRRPARRLPGPARRRTRARTCTCSASRTRTARRTPSSAAAPRRSCG